MPYFIINYDIGYGPTTEVEEADNLETATQIAHEMWREAVENNADYSAVELNQDTADEYGIDLEDYAD